MSQLSSYRRERSSSGTHSVISALITETVIRRNLSGMGSGQACGLRRNDKFFEAGL